MAARKVQPRDLATIIYTSGTTGEPKGVMLTHGNLMANVSAVHAVLALDETDTGLSFLPLCHAFERLVAYVYLTAGVSIVFAESFSTVGRDLVLVRPTVMTGVPRLFEKLHTRILDRGKESRGLKGRIFRWSVALAPRRGRLLEDQAPQSVWIRLQSLIADRLVFRKLRDSVGGRLRFAVSGGAALPPSLGRFFYGAGLPILEGYGLTETAPVLTVTTLGAIRFGTVGRALPGVDLRIADDNEILVRGPNVMAGYYGRPAETAEALRDGWFHTGDIGTLDADGYLQITDRKKELLVTSGGKNVAPQAIEGALGRDPLVAEAVLIGEGRHFLSALIVPDFDELAHRLGLPATEALDRRRLLERPDVRALYQKSVDAVNARRAQFERIKKFALLPHDFSVESGELTPTLKLKRRIIEEKYRGVIENIYLEG
jgi:long-chain acyl-CoA synthetase